MLKIDLPEIEQFDSESNTFSVIRQAQTVCLEHSLISISKWESKWHIPFMSKAQKTREQVKDYIRCMVVGKEIDDKTLHYMSNTKEVLLKIQEYIENPMTATTITNYGEAQKPNRKPLTSEEIYYSMVSYEIPFECEKWHINRLLMLINVCSIKNNPKKMSKKDLAKSNNAINAKRLAKMHSRG